MKKGISCLVQRHQELSHLAMCVQAKEWGYDGVEALMYETGELSMAASDGDLARVKEMTAEVGVEIVSLCPRVERDWALTSAQKETRDYGKEVVRGLIRCAGALGVDAFLLVPGRVSEEVRYDEALDRAGEALRELAPEAAAAGVTIAVENVWNRLLLSPVEARGFVDAVGSEGVGWYFDIGNVVLFGYPEQWIEILGRRIKRVHAKDFRRKGFEFTPLMEGDVDWARVMAALRGIGYDYYLISEVGGGDEAHPRTAAALDEIIAL
ncbi:MAG: sugar phosphate isomerase/epimerase family protein [Armatimonadota bacterium]